jgi:hypothetical protein
MRPRPGGGGPVHQYDESRLDSELIRLVEQQIDLMELAVFVRLTDAELTEYQRRENRISEMLEHCPV